MPATNQNDQFSGKTRVVSKNFEKNRDSLNIPSISVPKGGAAIKGYLIQ